MTIGRNDPCTCGSGKKYKKCCLATQELSKAVDFTYLRLRQVESQLIPRLMRHAAEIFGPEAFHEAWDDFNNYETEVGFDPEAPMNQAFMPWFLFNWTESDPEETVKLGAPIDITVAESFLEANDRQLSADEKMILNAADRCPFSFCEVVAIHPGTGMRLRDLMTDGEFEISERTASQSLQVGHIIFCATMYFANRFSNIATAPYPLPPIYKNEVLKLRKFIESDAGKKALRFEEMLVYGDTIRETYLDIVRQLFNPNIKLQNTDGDPLLPQKIMFQIEDPDFTFHKLKVLQEGSTEDELTHHARSEHGKIVEAEISWLGGKPTARKRLAGPILLGNIKIYKNQLTIEVNSHERAKRIRKEVETRLHGQATYKTTLIEPIEPKIEAMKNAKRSPERGAAIPFDQLPPEALAMIAKKSQDHWDSWFDIPVPALNNKTPKQSAKTSEGRDLLKSLLLYYEQQDAKSPGNIFRADVNMLRKKLGL